MDTSSSVNAQREYPTSAFLNSSALAVSDGCGLLYVLPIKESGASQPIGTFTLRTGGAIDAPFRLHHIHRPFPTTAVLLLSSRYYPAEGEKTAKSPAEFDIWAAKVNLLSLRTGNEPRQLEILWHRRGQDVPIYATFVTEVNSYLLVGGSEYPDPNVTASKPYEPTPEELAPIPRANENLDDIVIDKPEKPHPYSWTQSSDAVTVAFPLPSNTPKKR